MGLFGFGSKKDDSSVDIKSKVDILEKRTEVLNDIIKTKTLAIQTARVVFVIDVSGSMSDAFSHGLVQDVTERIMPLSLKFDDNGELEVYTFSNGYKEFPAATKDNFADYINKVVYPKIRWGGTEYAPVMKAITKRYAHDDPSDYPTFVVFMTDGDNSDKPQAEAAICEASSYNIFWKFVGIGRATMYFLERLDDMEGRVIDNANFFQVHNMKEISDAELYIKLLDEYSDWQNKARMKGILK